MLASVDHNFSNQADKFSFEDPYAQLKVGKVERANNWV